MNLKLHGKLCCVFFLKKRKTKIFFFFFLRRKNEKWLRIYYSIVNLLGTIGHVGSVFIFIFGKCSTFPFLSQTISGNGSVVLVDTRQLSPHSGVPRV